MYSNFRNLLRKCCSIEGFTPVRTAVKRSLPFDDSAADELPVYRYPKKKPSENIVYVWGLGEHGALGQYLKKRSFARRKFDTRFRTNRRPLRLRFGEYYKVLDVAAGFGFSLFTTKTKGNLKVYGTGINSDSQLGYQTQRKNAPLGVLLTPVPIKLPFQTPQETKVIGLGAGRAHSVIVTDKEGVFTLGNNAYGQCGRTIIENELYSNSQIIHHIKHLDGLQIQAVECGQDHTLFLTEKGTVYSCGWGADGQTGLGHTLNQSKPQRVLGDIEDEKIIKISSKADCVLALNDKGEVFGWGNSEYCQIFDEHATVQQVNKPIHLKKCMGFGRIVDIAAAGSYCMMLNEDGEVFTWGFGILGRGPNVSQSWKPDIIPPILFGRNDFSPDSKVVKIYCGLNHSAAINNYGDIYIWGKNKGSCLGLGDEKDQFFPLRVSIAAICRKLSLGVDHTLALCGTF